MIDDIILCNFPSSKMAGRDSRNTLLLLLPSSLADSKDGGFYKAPLFSSFCLKLCFKLVDVIRVPVQFYLETGVRKRLQGYLPMREVVSMLSMKVKSLWGYVTTEI